jgi:arginine decarboxylase
MLEILVTTGTGEGPTTQAAFHAALLDAGVANYNLIQLSSVIPEGSTVQRVRYVTPRDEYGHRLYVAMARHDARHVGQHAWAGLGWMQEKRTGRGYFVEVAGRARDDVEGDIRATLEAMMVAPAPPYGAIECELVGVECRGRPVCAVAIAVYRAAAWGGPR